MLPPACPLPNYAHPCRNYYFYFFGFRDKHIRCDDLESLGYVIVSILKEGSTALPWSGSTSVASGLAAKKSTTLETLCQGCPSGMLEYMQAVRGMKHEQEPDYDALDAMLKSMQSSSASAAPAAGSSKAAKGKPETAGGSGSSKSASASGASTKTASKKKSSKATEGDEQEEEEEEVEEMEVFQVESKGKGRPARAQRGSTADAAAKVPTAPAASTGQRVRRSRRLSSPRDEEEFFDALQEHDGNKKDGGEAEGEKEEPVVTKVVKGATKRTARGAATTTARAAPKATVKAKGTFVLEVGGMGVSEGCVTG